MPFRARRHAARLSNRRGILALALIAALGITTGAHDAAAKKRKKKESVAATIDGRRRKWGARKITAPFTAGGVTFIATSNPHRLNQFIPGVSLACQLDLTGPFPVTPAFPQLCVVGYSEVRFSLHPDPKKWGASNADGSVVVTFESFDGNRVTGTFHGTLASEDTPPNPSVTIQNGTFSIDVGG